MISSNCNNGSMYKTCCRKAPRFGLVHIKSQRSEDR